MNLTSYLKKVRQDLEIRFVTYVKSTTYWYMYWTWNILRLIHVLGPAYTWNFENWLTALYCKRTGNFLARVLEIFWQSIFLTLSKSLVFFVRLDPDKFGYIQSLIRLYIGSVCLFLSTIVSIIELLVMSITMRYSQSLIYNSKWSYWTFWLWSLHLHWWYSSKSKVDISVEDLATESERMTQTH